jgi:hypothetical protein
VSHIRQAEIQVFVSGGRIYSIESTDVAERRPRRSLIAAALG